jgi:radical SAM superfamily enzyme YgiQ (UPF0313 family)
MASQLITLVNANEMRPLVAPIALDYVAAAAQAQGFEVELLDLALVDDPEAAVRAYFADREPLLIGYTQRNLDDCFFAGQFSCLPHAREMLALLRRHADARLVIGGGAFSVAPQPMFEAMTFGLPVGRGLYGLRGDGEESLPALARALQAGEAPEHVPGLVCRAGEGWNTSAYEPPDLAGLPLATRPLLDHERYLREGGQCGFETKRGCPRECTYCADPIARGNRLRARSPGSVADELAGLADRGINVFHTCDCEFNVPPDHALAVCEALSARGLGDRVRWYAYCEPGGFPEELAAAMRRAGCVGINFGADHADDGMLRRLGRRHTATDLEECVQRCRRHGLIVMYDLLLCAPGETCESIRHTIEFMRRIAPDRAGVSAGLRLAPGTRLTREALRDGFGGPGIYRSAEAQAAGPTEDSLIWRSEEHTSELQSLS